MLIIPETAMRPIEKKIVTDEAGQPVAVQIDYADWLEIERWIREANSDQVADASTSSLRSTNSWRIRKASGPKATASNTSGACVQNGIVRGTQTTNSQCPYGLTRSF